MILKEFFEKDIDRAIETVIKADDRDNISTEVAEYVITNEIGKKIRDLFAAYIDYTGVNGVWISGFFGSGKSHLLKILSYVLENKISGDYPCGELFAEKIEEDEMLKGDVLKATRIPSHSILFNIDQQSQITHKSDANAILSVFYKVFYDHLGYYGFRPHVAEFEMWLDNDGIYQEFKDKFTNHFSKSWNEARIDYFDPDVEEAVAETLAEIKGGDADKYEDILEKMEDNQKHSIEDYCEKVATFINKQEKDFRLNFFVDEVGQYISDNTKLMLNLQTIAESLGTKTKGKSWIFVTSQEDMEKVVGDMNKQQQNDFSRIQARFALKVPLTSANVDEVIEKRLLKKTQKSKEDLQEHYQEQSANLSTLMQFSNEGVQFRGYADYLDFVNKFPFAPYQFDLFQNCRRALSSHNAFQGKHMSVGERSMLGVFQQVVMEIMDRDISAMVSFDLMYEGIRNELRSEVQSAIAMAEKNITDTFVVSVLKTLFMVKYFKNFKSTQRNVAVLLLDNINVDIATHDKRVQEALTLLENQSYIQRSGEVYEFLTDDEKDIEEEIKGIDLQDTLVNEELRTLIFDEIIRDNKIKFDDNKQDYDFCIKINGALQNKEKELGIELITPDYINYDSESNLKAETMTNNFLRIVLPSSSIFYKDLKLVLRTEKYVKQMQGKNVRPEIKRIIQEKSLINIDRKGTLKLQAQELMLSAKFLLKGGESEADAKSDAKAKVQRAFQELIKKTYPNLKMLGTQIFVEADIQKTIKASSNSLFTGTSDALTEAEQEVFNTIKRRRNNSDRTTLDDLQKTFSIVPFGWYNNAIWVIVAKLYKKAKLEVKMDGNILGDIEVVKAITNSRLHTNVLLEPQIDIDPKVIKNIKSVYKEAFDEQCPASEGKEVAMAFRDRLKVLYTEINDLVRQKNKYPFVGALEEGKEQIGSWVDNEYKFFLTSIHKIEDDLLDLKDDLITPIMTFWNGDQKKIFDSIQEVVSGDNSNYEYIGDEELNVLKEVVQHDKPYKGSTIKEAKQTLDILHQKVIDKITLERESTLEQLNQILDELKSKEEFQEISSIKKEQLLEPFDTLFNRIKSQRYIGTLLTIQSTELKNLKVKQWNELEIIYERLNTTPPTPTHTPADPKPYPVPENNPKVGETKVPENTPVATPPKPRKHYIQKDNIKVNFDKSELNSLEDVEKYINALKEEYKKQIQENRNIML